jgi:hypothetical protein
MSDRVVNGSGSGLLAGSVQPTSGIQPAHLALAAGLYFLVVHADVLATALLVALGIALYGVNYGSTVNTSPGPAPEPRPEPEPDPRAASLGGVAITE